MSNPAYATQQNNQIAKQAGIALERPSGWPVASFRSYSDAQAAVDGLSDRQFPVEALTIVGVDLMQVEKVTGRLTWPRILGAGALSGLWLGLFVGLLFMLFGEPFLSLISALLIGLIFGVVFAAMSYWLTNGKRDFSSATAIVAGRYDVLCEPSHAPAARDAIASMGLGTAGAVGMHSQPASEQPQTSETQSSHAQSFEAQSFEAQQPQAQSFEVQQSQATPAQHQPQPGRSTQVNQASSAQVQSAQAPQNHQPVQPNQAESYQAPVQRAEQPHYAEPQNDAQPNEGHWSVVQRNDAQPNEAQPNVAPNSSPQSEDNQ
ncbi:hypothetical protein CAQUA_07270 [Corynebacterium aquatimens]|uniref:General stress protein 17M-like domain-containing protein n=1 Tax=Corynebacterium aquatimens TaxID=1190508 RepID=A0A931E0D8_9CORY|nr:hypothetical protein [Corynebacterium aquatimens]WJY66150.1 hypothetical protein CAQUA_07270 [Corynebacterium aquatimens]